MTNVQMFYVSSSLQTEDKTRDTVSHLLLPIVTYYPSTLRQQPDLNPLLNHRIPAKHTVCDSPNTEYFFHYIPCNSDAHRRTF